MKYQITGYIKDFDCRYCSREICKYTSDIIPRIGEHIILPHKGTYKILEIIYHVTDDRKEYDNELMFVSLYLEFIS